MVQRKSKLKKEQPESVLPLTNSPAVKPDKVVTSKIEHTNLISKPITNSTSTAANMVEPALAYRMRVDELGADMYEYAVRITEGNMLNSKLALWEAIRRVEKQMREKGV